MTAFDSFSQSFNNHFSYQQDHIKEEQYLPMMDSFPEYNQMAWNTTYFSGADQDFKMDMMRTMSDNAMPPSLHSTASLASASSSTVGSPYSGHAQLVSNSAMQYNASPAIVYDTDFPHAYEGGHFDHEAFFQESKMNDLSVDPGVLTGPHDLYNGNAYGYAQQSAHYSSAPSPVPSCNSYASFSQPITLNNFSSDHPSMRRQSITSLKSAGSPRISHSADEDSREKGQCPYPECGKIFKDLKAHMISHGNVRPEKCPIVSCEYHIKGFARKYDKNRHTLTHYRGTMICGFCPGSGTASENTFNRADVFKRHLTSKHGVEQTPPNSRKRSPSKSNIKLSTYCKDATGKCSTCGSMFTNAQEFYEHLDDCVLKVVQQEEPSEAVNAKNLMEMIDDSEVQATFERNNLQSQDSPPSLADDDDEEDEDDDDEDDDDEDTETNERCGKGVIRAAKATSTRAIIGGNVSKKMNKRGLTWSKGGSTLIGKSRKRRKFYPPSWGMAADKMNMKKRVLCVNDGQRRLLKDDMMMHNMFEVRMPLLDGNSYVTDIDIETMKRAEAFHNALPSEKGPWIPEQDFLQLFEH